MRIEAAITLTEVACGTETQVTALALWDLIRQQIDKNATFLSDATVCHTILPGAIIH